MDNKELFNNLIDNKPMFEKPELKEYYIGYVDVLGYVNYINEHPGNEDEFLTIIYDCINFTEKTASDVNKVLQIYDTSLVDVIKIKCFSDNILIALEVDKAESNHLLLFLQAIKEIQVKFLSNGFLVKGTVIKDTLAINQHFVFGNGIINAYKKETSEKFPRITVSKAVIDDIANFQSMVKRDVDFLRGIIECLQCSLIGMTYAELIEKINYLSPKILDILDVLKQKDASKGYEQISAKIKQDHINLINDEKATIEHFINFYRELQEVFFSITDDAIDAIETRRIFISNFFESQLQALIFSGIVDEEYFIHYLDIAKRASFISEDQKKSLEKLVENLGVGSSELVNGIMVNLDDKHVDNLLELRLQANNKILRNGILQFCNADKIIEPIISRKDFDKINRIKMKYEWLKVYHNATCDIVNKKEYKIECKAKKAKIKIEEYKDQFTDIDFCTCEEIICEK